MRNTNTKLILLVLLGFSFGAFTSIALFNGPISSDNVKSGANIIGLEFTQQEIDSMLPGLEESRKAYIANRETPLSNGVSPSLVFNPIPQGFQVPNTPSRGGFGAAVRTVMPPTVEDLAFYSVRELAHFIQNKAVTSEQLTKMFIERLKKYNPELHCVITLMEESAIAKAKKADQEIAEGKYRGLLHGIPYGAKDLLATTEAKTTWGAAPFKDQKLNYNATVIQKLEDAGAILVAKLSMGALAWGDVWYGEMTRNPWNPEKGSSGSSAGSASAVAAGLVPFAIGTETLGSIVSPSTVCGTTGLRPTFGRVSRYGAMALSWSMDKIGPICRSSEDCAIVFSAIQGRDEKDPSSINASFNYNASLSIKNLTIGYVKSDFEKDYPFKDLDDRAIKALRANGINLVPIELPEMPEIGFILEAEAAAAFDELTLSGQDDQLVRQIQRAWPNVFRTARLIPAVEYIQANRKRTQLIEAMHKMMTENKLDAYLHPSWASTSLSITNFTGHPCLVLPTGLQEDGTPASISITGKLFGEAELITIGKSLEGRLNFSALKPKMFQQKSQLRRK